MNAWYGEEPLGFLIIDIEHFSYLDIQSLDVELHTLLL